MTHRAPPARAASRIEALLDVLCGVIMSWAVFAVSLKIYAATSALDRLANWDMASHADDGVRLADRVRAWNLVGFFTDIWGMSLWPPVFPFIESLFFLVFGYSYDQAIAMMAGMFALAVIASYWAAAQLPVEHPRLAGFISAALACTSPIFHLFGTMTMLELSGTILLLLSLGFYLRYQRHGRRGDISIAAACGTALFLCKYNYGIIWLAAIGYNEIRALAPSLAAVRDLMRRLAVPSKWLRPFPIFIAAYLLFIISILLTGGWIWTIAGHRVIVIGIGNPVHILLVIVTAALIFRCLRDRERCRHVLRSLAPSHQALLRLTLLPILLWLLIPPHMKDFFKFVRNRSSGMNIWSVDSLVFYPRSWLYDYSHSWWVGVFVALLALSAMLFRAETGRLIRPLRAAAALGILACLLHPYKDVRFFFTNAPLIWMCSAAAACAGIAWVRRTLGESAGWTLAPVLKIVLVLLTLGAGVNSRRLIVEYEQRTAPAEVRDVLDHLADQIDARPAAAVLGTWDGLSPALIDWHHRQRVSAGAPPPAVRDLSSLAREATDLPGRLAADRDLSTILLVEAMPQTGPAWFQSYARECVWVSDAKKALLGDQRFRVAGRRAFKRAGYSVIVFSKLV